MRDATTGRLIGIALLIWLLILLLAIANGVLRESVLVPRLGAVRGLAASGLLLTALIIGVTLVALPWLGRCGQRELLLVGAGWLLATLVFEVGFGLLRGQPLAAILAACDMRGGNLWLLVLATTALAPWLAGKLRGWF